MQIKINAEQLRRALKDIEEAEAAGFMHCLAVFNEQDINDYWREATYSDLWTKAHPTDASLDWGRGGDMVKRFVFKDGKAVPTAKTEEAMRQFPEGPHIEKGEIDGYKYWIVPHRGTLNGYLAFPERPVVETGYDGIMRYVPVHGGITYAKHGIHGMVYGFDTKHIDSEQLPINDKAWIKGQIEIMLKAILIAKDVEKEYLIATTNEQKAPLVQKVADACSAQQMNFGVNIALLSGKL